ncbi:hypothetical protein Avbf_18261 [Armadillidium vulgare]|nr:hypothetical protein Avbf_18261 [Armadillidium vulgare]
MYVPVYLHNLCINMLIIDMKCAKIIHPYVVDNCCLFKGTSVRLNSDSPNIPLRRITSTLCEVPVVGACLSQYTAIPVVGAYLTTYCAIISVVGTYSHLSEFFCCEGLFVNLFVYLNSYSGSSSNNS